MFLAYTRACVCRYIYENIQYFYAVSEISYVIKLVPISLGVYVLEFISLCIKY